MKEPLGVRLRLSGKEEQKRKDQKEKENGLGTIPKPIFLPELSLSAKMWQRLVQHIARSLCALSRSGRSQRNDDRVEDSYQHASSRCKGLVIAGGDCVNKPALASCRHTPKSMSWLEKKHTDAARLQTKLIVLAVPSRNSVGSPIPARHSTGQDSTPGRLHVPSSRVTGTVGRARPQVGSVYQKQQHGGRPPLARVRDPTETGARSRAADRKPEHPRAVEGLDSRPQMIIRHSQASCQRMIGPARPAATIIARWLFLSAHCIATRWHRNCGDWEEQGGCLLHAAAETLDAGAKAHESNHLR